MILEKNNFRLCAQLRAVSYTHLDVYKRQEHGEAPEWMPNQYFAALTNMRSVGVMGDERTYDYAVALLSLIHI